MKKPKKVCFLLMVVFALFFLWPSLIFSDEALEGKKIIEVNLEGLFTSEVFSVRSVLETKARSNFSQKTIDNDIKAFYNLELFDDIRVDVVEEEEGLIVTFIFVELPVIRELVVKGNKKVKKHTIRDRILLKKGSVYLEQDVYSDLEEIKNLYEEKGFPDATVSYSTKDTKEKNKKTGEKINSIDLIFSVKEGKKLVIKELIFSGIKAIEEDKLRGKIKTRRRGYRFSSGFFKENQFELDKREILRYYESLGYIDTEILKVDKQIERNEEKKRDEMILTIYIDEGEQYTFGGVNISGNTVFTDDELYSLIELEEGDVFDKTEWDTNVQSIRNLLASNGYIYYLMNMEEKKDIEKFVISYEIELSENNKAHVENIFITGNDKTKKLVIEREIDIEEGEIFNAGKIQRSTEKLYNLQYFSTVNIDVKEGSEIGLVDLIFDVEEQRTGLFSFGLSYSTAGYGISLFEEVSANNFLGRGLRLYEKVDIGRYHQAIELGIDESWLFNTPTSAGITLSWSRIEYGKSTGDLVYTWNDGDTEDGTPTGDPIPDDGDPTDHTFDPSTAKSMEYLHRSYKTAFRLGRRFGYYYGVNSELAFSVFQNTTDSDDDAFDEELREQLKAGWQWKNYLALTGYRDSRDNSLFATKGTYIAQSFTFFGGPFGGYSDLLKLNTDFNVNVKTFWKFVLSTRLNFGFIVPLPGLPLTIDDSDYIRVDCMNEGRGWQRPSSQFESLYSLRGRSELNISVEHRFPIEERVIWGITFFDISGLYNPPSDFTYDIPDDFTLDPKELYYSLGFGVSLMIPGFPLRFYLVRRFKYDDEIGKWQFANSQTFLRNWDFVFAVAGFF